MSKILIWMFRCSYNFWSTSYVEAYRTYTDYTRKCNCTHIYRTLSLFLSGSDGYNRSQWPPGPRRGTVSACLVGLRVRIAVESGWERRKIIAEECQLLTERMYNKWSSANIIEYSVGRKMYQKSTLTQTDKIMWRQWRRWCQTNTRNAPVDNKFCTKRRILARVYRLQSCGAWTLQRLKLCWHLLEDVLTSQLWVFIRKIAMLVLFITDTTL